MRRLIALLLLPASACASASESAGIPSASTGQSTVRIDAPDAALSGLNLQLTREAEISTAAVPASTRAVWTALPQVFEELGIPLSGVQTANRMLTASGQRLRRIGDKGISTYFDCPGSYGNAASSADVYFTVQAQVIGGDSDSTSTVRTRVDAYARATTSGTQVLCSTRGALERLIMERLMARVSA